MNALIILLFLGIWSALLYNAGFYASFAIKRKSIRRALGITAVIAVTTLVLWDEIEGTREFERLCASGGVYQIAPEAIGKKFDLKSSYSDYIPVLGLTRPVDEQLIGYTDIASGSVMATGKAFFAKGGWMIRKGFLIDSSGGKGPLFGRSQCFPDQLQNKRLQEIANSFIH
jgi:hypothetical protein